MATTPLSQLIHRHRPDTKPLEDLYKHLHQHPELSNQESETAATIVARLEAIAPADLIIKSGIGGHGIAATLRNSDGPVVLLRADIDALPVEERTGLAYASTKRMVHAPTGVEKPVMHACGHDMHIVCLLGAAEALFSSRKHWSGTLVLVFQPAEERGTGAQAMVDDGLYSTHGVPIPDIVLGVTSGPCEPAQSAHAGALSLPARTAFESRFTARVPTQACHILSRETDPAESSVVTVATVHAGDAENVIPDTAVLGIDTRSTTVAARERIMNRIQTIIHAESSCAGAPKVPEFEQTRSFPLTINDEAVTQQIEQAFAGHFGEGPGQFNKSMPRLSFSEDFAILATSVGKPYCFFTYGCVDEELWDRAEREGSISQTVAANHSSKFAPVIMPTLKVGMDGYTLGALSFLVSATTRAAS
ncbi:hypothetical protein ACCO45_007592 [Purpureocillium lilacinum]|uniref:Uncharacterized protein n=1 Tax=Purpureocillium lilacinum TaxID=33203 RepID=A0ACC4DN81_PURLI